MPWDTDATRARLLGSATTHFAADGYAGARVDAIARTAGVNKERIYPYFGDKAGLFAAVVAAQVEHFLHGIELTGPGEQAVGVLAGILFDRAHEDPRLPRLLAWESLELDEPVAAVARAKGCAEMVDTLRRLLPGLGREEAEALLLSVIAIAVLDECLPHLRTLVAPRISRARRRELVIAQARALARMAATS
ncbi:TetR/AcrR family transcriptional regulator [Microbacterium fluvii]|uniref:TetR/AcrR family transcriptional regulator n=1 Tax=Microbacterium fluvii TaxID=415215 RepID=A0ABW2HHV4_9MICO|nr:TetR/AcrR family transcriptional regulator [Microbacterium fluvii]MCU4673051.1 TetR/AcrR family transcriptional regulator [Microbacterium fluvii]